MSWADLSDVRCYYEVVSETVDPRETVLLIPGLGSTCRVWDEAARYLSGHFCLLLPDNRGVGRSTAKRSPRTIRHFSTDLVELLDHLQLDRVHVIGLSLGGIIAQQLAIDHPGRVRRLVLISCGHRFGAYLYEMARFMVQAMRHWPRRQYVRSMEMLSSGPEFIDAHPQQFEAEVDLKLRCKVSRRATIHQLRCLRAGGVDSTYDIRCPTLVIAGEYDVLIPNCYARRMAQDIPGSEFVTIAGAGHNPLRERPEEVLPRIMTFLSASPGLEPRGAPARIQRRAGALFSPGQENGRRPALQTPQGRLGIVEQGDISTVRWEVKP